MRNIAKCRKCGDIIESVFTHHFTSCKCNAISIDGGTDYRRALAKDLNDIQDLTPEELEAWDAIPTGRLEKWSIQFGTADFPFLIGEVYEDKLKRFKDEASIRTSLVREWEGLKEGDLVRTLGSTYLLGEPYKSKKRR